MSELPVPSVEPQTVPDNALTIAGDFKDSVASGSIQCLLTSKLQCEEAVTSRGNWKKAADWLASVAELNPSLKQITSQLVSGPDGKEIRMNDLSALLGPSMLSHSMVNALVILTREQIHQEDGKCDIELCELNVMDKLRQQIDWKAYHSTPDYPNH
ncbi:hypothetical protein JB92DRAFT_2839376 [Gautieria morchelliformis]|nr:hypothetical protein JB92DRAFT_2839376 [Gautieria morchelliformis]